MQGTEDGDQWAAILKQFLGCIQCISLNVEQTNEMLCFQEELENKTKTQQLEKKYPSYGELIILVIILNQSLYILGHLTFQIHRQNTYFSVHD